MSAATQTSLAPQQFPAPTVAAAAESDKADQSRSADQANPSATTTAPAAAATATTTTAPPPAGGTPLRIRPEDVPKVSPPSTRGRKRKSPATPRTDPPKTAPPPPQPAQPVTAVPATAAVPQQPPPPQVVQQPPPQPQPTIPPQPQQQQAAPPPPPQVTQVVPPPPPQPVLHPAAGFMPQYQYPPPGDYTTAGMPPHLVGQPPPQQLQPQPGPPPTDQRVVRQLSTSKRAEQNRKAQRAFRERRDQHVKALESRSQLLDAALASADEANRRWEECRVLVDQLRMENATLRQALAKAQMNGVEGGDAAAAGTTTTAGATGASTTTAENGSRPASTAPVETKES